MTYVNTATFSLYLLPLLCTARKKKPKEFSPEEYVLIAFETLGFSRSNINFLYSVYMETEARLLGEEDVRYYDLFV